MPIHQFECSKASIKWSTIGNEPTDRLIEVSQNVLKMNCSMYTVYGIGKTISNCMFKKVDAYSSNVV